MKIASIFKKIFKLSKKVLIPGIIILAILGFLLFKPKTNPQQMEFTEVKRQDIKSVVSSSGTLTGKNSVNLKFKSGGRLAYINVKAGDVVNAWQTIAGLDTQDLNIDLQQAQNTLRDKQATVEKILDDVKDHDEEETFSQKQTRTSAEVAKDNAFDDVKAAQRAFQDAVLVTPMSGLVTQSSVVAGQNISTSDTIAQIVDFSEIFFDTEIDEADIGKITLDQKVEVTMDAYPNKIFEGSVAEIIPQTKTTSSGATVITVRINLGTAAITPIHGLSGQASIILNQSKNVLTLPLEAVREDSTVVIQTANGLENKKIVTGVESDTDVEIKAGLDEGDRVLLDPPAELQTNRQNFNRGGTSGVFRFLGGGRGR